MLVHIQVPQKCIQVITQEMAHETEIIHLFSYAYALSEIIIVFQIKVPDRPAFDKEINIGIKVVYTDELVVQRKVRHQGPRPLKIAAEG